MTRRIVSRRYQEPILKSTDDENVKPEWDHHQRGNSSSSRRYTISSRNQFNAETETSTPPVNERNSEYHSQSKFDPCIARIGNSLYSPSRVTPDTSLEYDKEHNPEDNHLQSLSSLKCGEMVRRTPVSSITPATIASWDAILHDDEKKEPEGPYQLSECNLSQDATSVVSAMHTRKVGGRIARLASIFSSRATVQVDEKEGLSPVPSYPRSTVKPGKDRVRTSHREAPLKSPVPPVSPAQSSGSSAYVGWPGTQDRRGRTVTQQSSYDDSSVGAGSSLHRSSLDNIRDKEIQEAAFKEMSRWTKSTEDMATGFDDNLSVGSSANVSFQPRIANRRSRAGVPCRSSPVQEEDARIVGQASQLASDDSSAGFGSDGLSAAEYHLAAAVADAKRSQPVTRQSMSALRYAKSDIGQIRNLPAIRATSQPSAISANNSISTNSVRFDEVFPPDRTDPNIRRLVDTWGSGSSVGDPSSPEGSNVSKSSAGLRSPGTNTSAYNKENRLEQKLYNTNENGSRYVDSRSTSDDSVIRSSLVRPPTEDALAENNRRTPPHRTFPNGEGFMGLLDKTKEVPSLLDNLDSDSMSSSKATSVYSGTNSSYHHVSVEDISSQSQQLQRQLNFRTNKNEMLIRGILRNGNHDAPVDTDGDSDVFDGLSVAKESDVFDNVFHSPRKARADRTRNYPASIIEENDSGDNNEIPTTDVINNDFKIVILAGGITTIQSPDFDYSNRRTASDYDDQLTASEVSSNGYTRIPGFEEMFAAGTDRDSSLHGIHGNIGQARRPRNTSNVARSLVLEDITCLSDGEDAESDDHSCSTGYNDSGDLSQYYVQPSLVKRLLNKYREMSDFIDSDMSLEEFEKEEDEHRAFALFEMRSRIMEKDIERGLERRGGTVVVDDIVTTSYHRTAHRIRDAVIVCKAWRDGASFSDVVKASLLGRRGDRTYYVKRRIRNGEDHIYNSSIISDTASFVSGFSSASSSARFYWEPVKWLDDTDILQYRCPSLGSRHMRGFEMFTIGDCQSILLKLTNERCMVRDKFKNTHSLVRERILTLCLPLIFTGIAS
jgi:hypothetical protein